MTSGRAALFVAVALLAGCAGSTAPLQAPLPASQPETRVDFTGSWMAPSADKHDLLYVSDAKGSVRIFSYPRLKQVGLLQGFRSPAGVCSDPHNGDVYVVDTPRLALFKFRHGGTKSVKTLNVFGYFPYGCAV